ncbi:hypothetical protein M2347_002510 [Chryseobacterium sp. H1D6B]|uniref:hypothetical protein n=1 Tax=Chryseobacterium sp. H1D6B TaxID=2940588 RepID=UPI0015C8597B|nr:hypothetical protein [Chryseobacterium sp. H1D6B]MDH6252783.1 hypothetical protein [Chryseobacterium sp. H1D6B]
MASQEQKKGQITITAKNIKGTSHGQILEESKRTRNTAGGKHIQNGANGGVSHNVNKERKLPLELRVLKVEGPFDPDTKKKVEVIEKDKWYSYKVTQYNRTPKKEELQHLKWATEYDDSDTKPLLKEVSDKGISEIMHMVKNEAGNTKLRVYAFFKAPNKNVSVETKILQGEIVLIVGTEQHSQTYGNKLMFPSQAVREVRENYASHKHATIIIFKDAFTAMQLSIIKRDARVWNKTLYFKQINSTAELVQYINKGDATVNRGDVKIETIKIFSHGLPSVLDFGLDGKNEEAQRFKISHVNQLSKESFVKKPVIYSYACRTGNVDDRIVTLNPSYKYDAESIKLVKPEESLAQKLSEHLDAKVYAYLRRSNYTSSWLDGGNKEYKQHYITIEDEEVSNPLNPKDWFRKGWDEALWNYKGAYLLPTSGNSPGGLLEGGMFIFEKGKKPEKQ